MRSEHYQPVLSNRVSREEWESEGKKVTWEKASEIVRQVMDDGGYGLPAAIKNQIVSEIPGIVS